ncbi:Trp family transcriptional regulator [Fluviispira multicolorata]|uniref:Transcriptional regulator n=1 Tax=Fluviispira multicolorata TaxID=2654512 RepID=A0A833JFW8_9BACT|nr:Trp family transcriptional regulator [Fluviispira multicolorata]KAB8031846.1 transcriptional regulator [Fluviispira multicolorata]
MFHNKSQKTSKEIIHFLNEVKYKDLNSNDCEQLLKVFLTPAEIDAISQRVQIVDLISKGVAQREISEKLGVGIATVTRGSRMLQENPDLLKRVFPREEETH